jgi:hypothetical protein
MECGGSKMGCGGSESVQEQKDGIHSDSSSQLEQELKVEAEAKTEEAAKAKVWVDAWKGEG